MGGSRQGWLVKLEQHWDWTNYIFTTLKLWQNSNGVKCFGNSNLTTQQPDEMNLGQSLSYNYLVYQSSRQVSASLMSILSSKSMTNDSSLCVTLELNLIITMLIYNIFEQLNERRQFFLTLFTFVIFMQSYHVIL